MGVILKLSPVTFHMLSWTIFWQSASFGHVQKMCSNIPSTSSHLQHFWDIWGYITWSHAGVRYHLVRNLYHISCYLQIIADLCAQYSFFVFLKIWLSNLFPICLWILALSVLSPLIILNTLKRRSVGLVFDPRIISHIFLLLYKVGSRYMSLKDMNLIVSILNYLRQNSIFAQYL